MKVKLNDQELKINWRYIVDTQIVTTCFIDGLPVGHAFCSITDNFVKETGRKLSLARALKAFGLGREGRKIVWETYFNRKNG